MSWPGSSACGTAKTYYTIEVTRNRPAPRFVLPALQGTSMHQAKSVISLICVVFIMQPAFAGSPAVDDTPRAPAHEVIKPAGGWFTKAYRQPVVPPVDVSNSGRLDALIRA